MTHFQKALESVESLSVFGSSGNQKYSGHMCIDFIGTNAIQLILHYIADIDTYRLISREFKHDYPIFAKEANILTKPIKVYFIWQFGYHWKHYCLTPLCFSTSSSSIDDCYNYIFDLPNAKKHIFLRKNYQCCWTDVAHTVQKQNLRAIRETLCDIKHDKESIRCNGYWRENEDSVYTKVSITHIFLNDPTCQELYVLLKLTKRVGISRACHVDDYTIIRYFTSLQNFRDTLFRTIKTI